MALAGENVIKDAIAPTASGDAHRTPEEQKCKFSIAIV
jgi:hypothetical protein